MYPILLSTPILCSIRSDASMAVESRDQLYYNETSFDKLPQDPLSFTCSSLVSFLSSINTNRVVFYAVFATQKSREKLA